MQETRDVGSIPGWGRAQGAQEGMAIHSIRFGHNWSDLAHEHTAETHQWLISKVYFMLQLQCRSAVKGYSLQSLRDLGWEDASLHVLLRSRDRELKGFHSVKVSAQKWHTSFLLTFNWPKQIMWSPQSSSFSLESLNVCEWLPHTDRL